MTTSNPIKIPPLTSASPAELFTAIAANINDADVAESTQRNYVIRCLAALGHGRSPEILTGQMEGSRVRLYLWTETPIGDVILVTGPSWRGKLVRADEIKGTPEAGFWFEASPDQSAAKAKVDAYREQTTQRVADASARAIARAEKPAPRPRASAAERPPAPRAAPPAAVDTEAGEKAELRAGIDSLAALLR